jgi:hypothetical protein
LLIVRLSFSSLTVRIFEIRMELRNVNLYKNKEFFGSGPNRMSTVTGFVIFVHYLEF